jgi:iduronate 2-sulfatase
MRHTVTGWWLVSACVSSFVAISLCAPHANAEGKPKVENVLFILSDDLKASLPGCYGNTVCKTPNLDRLADRGMVFERAYCQGLACSPSRPSFMRSVYPGGKQKTPTIGEVLQNRGMHTARVGKVFHMPVPHAQLDGSNGADVAECWTERYNTKSAETFTPGLYRLLNKGIVTRKVEGRDAKGPNRMWATVEADSDGSDQADHMCATKAIELLKQRKAAGKPFFLAVGFVRPHFPMVQPKKFFDMYPFATMKLPESVPNDLDDIPDSGRESYHGGGLNELTEGRQRMWQAYCGSVSFMDQQLGRVLDELDRLGLRETTAIVFTTDHGYHLGEHGFWQKMDLHEEVVRVPFIISVPGMKPGRSKSFVELVDIYPTCTDLLGVPAPDSVQGKSLVPLLRDPSATVRDNTALSVHTRRRGFGLRGPGWAYMTYGGKGGKQQEELYDMVKDPKQFTNVAKVPKYAEMLKEARAKLKARLETR